MRKKPFWQRAKDWVVPKLVFYGLLVIFVLLVRWFWSVLR